MKHSLRTLAMLFVAVCLGVLAACAGTPTAAQAVQIQAACAVDAGIRPSVNVLLAVPGLATVQEVAAVTAARAVIDPVCANPSGSFEANTVSAFTAATTQVLTTLAELKSRQSAPPAPVKTSARDDIAHIPRVTA